MTTPEIEYAFIGGLREDYCITPEGRAYLGVIGGNAIFAAVGARLWSDSIGLVSRVGANYPPEWLAKLGELGFNTDGINITPDPQDIASTRADIYRPALTIQGPVAGGDTTGATREGLPLHTSLIRADSDL